MQQTKKMSASFYINSNVLMVAKQLLGKVLVTNINGIETKVRIVETEAYNGVNDKASHAYGNRRTARTAVMYQAGGCAYVYLCYGIHHLFNVVTGVQDNPQAVLIRAAEPLVGIDEMLKRSKHIRFTTKITSGPGNVSQSLGIQTKHTGVNLNSKLIYIEDDGYLVSSKQIIATPRIGVGYAQEDALLPYRFIIQNNPFISGNKKQNLLI